MIPKSEVTLGLWTGTGYVVSDPDTGSAAYMISGGLAGGSTMLYIVDFVSLYVGTLGTMIDSALKALNLPPAIAGTVISVVATTFTFVTNEIQILKDPNLSLLEFTLLLLANAILFVFALIVAFKTASLAFGTAVAYSVAYALFYEFVFSGLKYWFDNANIGSKNDIFYYYRRKILC